MIQIPRVHLAGRQTPFAIETCMRQVLYMRVVLSPHPSVFAALGCLRRVYSLNSLLLPDVGVQKPKARLMTGNKPLHGNRPLCDKSMPKLPSAVWVFCSVLLALLLFCAPCQTVDTQDIPHFRGPNVDRTRFPQRHDVFMLLLQSRLWAVFHQHQ